MPVRSASTPRASARPVGFAAALVLALAATGCGPTELNARTVEAAVAPELDRSPGVVSAEFTDTATGEVLYGRDAARAAAPASGLKVLTAATALRVLGAERTLRTRVVAFPLGGGAGTELVLVGGGDVLLGAGVSDPDAVVGRAGLRTLAERTVAGMREQGILGDVVLTTDLRLFEDAGLNPAWPDDLLRDGFISAVQPLATYGGRTAPGTGQERIPNPAGFAATTFQRHLADVLAETGADVTVTVRDKVPATKRARADVLAATPLGQVVSAPVSEVVAFMLAHSENQVAESLLRVAAAVDDRPATDDGVAAMLEASAAALGADPAGLHIVDASGLGEGNRVSAAQLADVVVAVVRDPGLAVVRDALPEPGEDSTLGDRFLGTPAQDAMAAKTGTLDNTVSLTGTLDTDDGRVIAFSVIASDVQGQLEPAREAVDASLVALAGR